MVEMKSFVPRDKMSKRARKKLDAQNRTTWAFNPATKIVKSKKVYDRKKQPRNYEPYDFRGCFFCRNLCKGVKFTVPVPDRSSPYGFLCTVPAGA